MAESVVANLPPGTATMTKEVTPSGSGAPSATFTLQPERSGAASVSLSPDVGDTVFVALGEHGWTELLVGPREWSELVPLARELLDAAVAGRVRERIWSRHGEYVNSLSYVERDGRWALVGDTSRPLFRWRVQEEGRRYLPWVL